MNILLITTLGLFASSVSVPSDAAQLTINGPAKDVWAATVHEVTNRAPLKIIDRDSGTISTDTASIDIGFNNRGMSQYVTKLRGLAGALATWDGLQVRLNVQVHEDTNNSSTVTVNAQFRAFENNAQHRWIDMSSNGMLEGQILNSIKTAMPKPAPEQDKTLSKP